MADSLRAQGDSSSSTPTPKASTPTPDISPSFGQSITDIAKQIAGVDTQAANSLNESRGTQLKLLDKIIDNQKNRPAAPELTKPEAPPSGHTPPNPIQSWGSVASALATFGSLATRRPLMNALNASASAMNAIRANDTEAYQRAQEEWKQHAEYAQKVNEWELNRYNLLRDQYKDDNEALLANYNALAHLDQNTALIARIKTEGLSGVESALKDQRDWGLKLKEYNLQVQSAADAHEASANNLELLYSKAVTSGDTEAQKKYLEAIRAKHLVLGSAGKGWDLYTGANGQQYRYNKDTAEITHADGTPLAPGEDPGKLAKQGVGPRSASAMYLQKYMETHPNASDDQIAQAMADYSSIQKAVSAFATGKQGDTLRSFETVSNHLDTLEQAARALNNGDWTLFNKYANGIASATGQPAPTNFATAMQIVGGEIIKSVQGTPGGVTDREEARGAFDTVRSPEQLQGAIDTVRHLIGGQLQSMESQYKDTTHRDDFRQRLHGKALGLLQYVDQSGEAESSGSGQPSAGGGASAGKYKSADDVFKAFDSGDISKNEAKRILTEQFGYKAQ